MAAVRRRAWRSLVAAFVLTVPGLVVPGSALAGESNAGHALADQFARDSATAPAKPQLVKDDQDRLMLERKLQDEERLRADEQDMLMRAREEAEARRAAERADAERKAKDAEDDRAARDRAAAEAARINEAKRLAAEKAEADRPKQAAEKAEAERQKVAGEKAEAERQKVAAEKAEAERQKVAAEKAEAERQKVAAEKAEAERQKVAAEKAEAERQRQATEIAAAKQRIEDARKADAERQMSAEREEEARRLSEKLARARQQREERRSDEGYSALGNPPPEPDDAHAANDGRHHDERDYDRGPASAVPSRESRVTILLVIDPGKTGIRRYEKTGDPIVCVGDSCFISQGVDDPAKMMVRARALGAGNTLGQRAGACRHALSCTFRDVEVGAGSFQLQPIDMRIMRHDRRETLAAQADSTCTVVAGRLKCARGVQAGSYRAWIVPESLARRAGSAALSEALEDGLSVSAAALHHDW